MCVYGCVCVCVCGVCVVCVCIGVGRGGGRRGRTTHPFWGQILYISYIKC